MIGGPDGGGVSPTGPHTHVLPKLLRARRSHSANIPIPEGLVPVAGFHPASPIMDSLAHDRDFDREVFETFQQLLAVWGDQKNHTIKQRVWQALARKLSPEQLAEPDDRAGRVAFRVALRQLGRRDGESQILAQWRATYDRELVETDRDALGRKAEGSVELRQHALGDACIQRLEGVEADHVVALGAGLHLGQHGGGRPVAPQARVKLFLRLGRDPQGRNRPDYHIIAKLLEFLCGQRRGAPEFGHIREHADARQSGVDLVEHLDRGQRLGKIASAPAST